MAARRYSLFFYAALIVALLATYGVYRTIETAKTGTRIATTPVVVAARDINQGELIDRIALVVADWPAPTVPAGAYGRVDSVAGRVARVDVFKGEPFVPGRLAPEGMSAGLLTKIIPGRRAMSVRINDVSGVSGMIQPNSRVDILLTPNTVGADGRRQTKIFMENMRVLSIGTVTQTAADGRPIAAPTATLDVSPQEAEKLGVAQTLGTIQLLLRGYGDPTIVNTKGASSSDVAAALRDYAAPANTPAPRSRIVPVPRSFDPAAITSPAPAAAPPPIIPRVTAKPESTTIQIYKGGARTEAKFKKDSLRKDTLP